MNALERLGGTLATAMPRIVACSGGIDSLLLATIAHRLSPAGTRIAHAISPAVQTDGTDRVRKRAALEGWTLELVETGEFEDEDYLRNPSNRCYHCKSHLYARLADLARGTAGRGVLLSGTNLDDLGEFRPGLIAAEEVQVRHPFVEAGLGKRAIRELARELGLPFAELPASPCLSSRLYTGTRVTPSRLLAVNAGENAVRTLTGIAVVRCRIREDQVLIEVEPADRDKVTPSVIERVTHAMRSVEAGIAQVALDPSPYKAGRSFVLERVSTPHGKEVRA